MGVVKNAVSGLGFDQDAAMVTFPIDLFLAESDIASVKKRGEEFIDGLTHWKAAAGQTGLRNAPMIEIEGEDYEEAFTKANHLFLTNLWGDGFPIVPPSEKRVDRILTGTDLPRDHVLGKFMPRGGIVTVETVAVALTMAGGRPEYLPILLAAVDGILEPDLMHDTWQATSASTYPVIVVSGPIAKEIRLNSGFGLLGPDPQRPAGASLGRAIRLLQQNVGGALPGVGTMAAFGQMRYANAVFAEDEDGIPEGWKTVAEDRHGFVPGTNAVTVFISTGASNILRRGVGKDSVENECLQSLHRVVRYLKQANPHYLRGYETGTPGALLIPRAVAKQLASVGWTQESIKQFLWENSRLTQHDLQSTGLKPWIAQFGVQSIRETADDDPWYISRRPDNILLVTAGGAHPTHNFWMQGNSRVVVGREVRLPGTWRDLLAQADKDLGCGSDVCLI
ncbi:MAG: hypothetical protein WD407_13850 [Rhodospirillales bacterium]